MPFIKGVISVILFAVFAWTSYSNLLILRRMGCDILPILVDKTPKYLSKYGFNTLPTALSFASVWFIDFSAADLVGAIFNFLPDICNASASWGYSFSIVSCADFGVYPCAISKLISFSACFTRLVAFCSKVEGLIALPNTVSPAPATPPRPAYNAALPGSISPCCAKSCATLKPPP